MPLYPLTLLTTLPGPPSGFVNDAALLQKVSTESMLHLAFGRWLLDFWSEPSSFSRTELRNMLLQAVFSVERRELPAVTPVPYVHKMAIDSSSTGGIPDRGDRLVGEQLRPASMEGAMARLAEWLGGPTGRRSEAEIDAEETVSYFVGCFSGLLFSSLVCCFLHFRASSPVGFQHASR